jgi:hypothetical protein
MAIPLPPSEGFHSQTPDQNWTTNLLSSKLVPCLLHLVSCLLHLVTDHIENSSLFLRSCLLLQERVYRAFALKPPWYICPSRGRCIATGLHATIYLFIFILWNIEQLIGNDRETNNETTIIGRKRPARNRKSTDGSGVFYVVCSEAIYLDPPNSVQLVQWVELSELVGEWVSQAVSELEVEDCC